MSVADCRSARRKMKLRYKGGRATRSIAEQIAAERNRAASEAKRKSAKK